MQRATDHAIRRLPAGFTSLELLVEKWAIGTESQRRARRAASSMQELHAYYGLVGPQMRAIAAHLDSFAIGPLPEPEQRLLHLAQMFMEVAIAVEFFGQPELPEGFPRERYVSADV